MVSARLAVATATLLTYVAWAVNSDSCSECESTSTNAERSQQQAPHHALLQVRNRLSSTIIVPDSNDKARHATDTHLPAEGLIDLSVFRTEPNSSQFGLTDFDKDYVEDSNNPLDAYTTSLEAGADSTAAAVEQQMNQSGAVTAGTAAAAGAAGEAAGDAAGTAAAGTATAAGGDAGEAAGASAGTAAAGTATAAGGDAGEADGASAGTAAAGATPAADVDGGADAGAGATAAAASDAGAAAGAGTACCEEDTAACLACTKGLTVETYCTMNGTAPGCDAVFDCAAGFDNWQLGWSDLKKSWCCINKQVACPESANGTAAGGLSLDDGDLFTDGIVPNASVPNSTVGAPSAGPRCVTRRDPRASSFGYTTALPGTPCVFGVDDRDEGSHCIMEDGKFGSFGWCWTTKTADAWGSCSESCPLFGPSKVLGDHIKTLEKKLAAALTTTTTTTAVTTTTTSVANLTNATNATNATASESNATKSSAVRSAKDSSGKGPGRKTRATASNRSNSTSSSNVSGNGTSSNHSSNHRSNGTRASSGGTGKAAKKGARNQAGASLAVGYSSTRGGFAGDNSP